MRGILILIGLFIVVAGGWLMVNLIPASGVFKNLEPLLVEQCTSVEVAPGTEDVTIDEDLGVAFISAADRRAWYNETGAPGEGAAPTNAIYTMDLAAPHTIRRVSPPMDDFLPHGIYLWRGDDGEKRLFVVNHPSSGAEIIEIFEVGEGGALTHLESISFDAMHSPNDVLAVGPRQFYATNDRGYEEGIMSTIEAYFALPFSSVAYYDGETGRIAAKGLTYANGINISADGETVYVSEFLKRKVAVYKRNLETGALTFDWRFHAGTGPDNIEIAPDGALWIGGHTKVFDFLKHAEDPKAIAPSHVVRVDLPAGRSEDIFIDTTGAINGSSVGAANDDMLIVGAVFDSNVMVCPLD